MTILAPDTWRRPTPDEMIRLLRDRSGGIKKSAKATEKKKRFAGGPMVFREHLSPFDVYSYLRARFGKPNGMQSVMIHGLHLVRDDSANMFHWDYVLLAETEEIYVTGAAREVHVMVARDMSDNDWLDFADNLKQDFANLAKEKKAIVSSWQKWHVFHNRYNSLAQRCAELLATLERAMPALKREAHMRVGQSDLATLKSRATERGKLVTRLTNAAIELTIITPVLFESFIGLLVATHLRPEVRQNRRLYDAFKRSPLDVKIFELASKCQGFNRPIEDTNAVMRAYWRVVNERNDVIHGNVDPVGDALEIVYFEGNKPIHRTGGDAIQEFWNSLLDQYRPEQVISNYLLAHEMIIEILNHMTPGARKMMQLLMEDTQPGWDDDRKKAGKLFPDFVLNFGFDGIRYDTDLIDTRRAKP